VIQRNFEISNVDLKSISVISVCLDSKQHEMFSKTHPSSLKIVRYFIWFQFFFITSHALHSQLWCAAF